MNNYGSNLTISIDFLNQVNYKKDSTYFFNR